ncbi:PREDICTED: defensin-like protein 194 [Camelina sativa]|uniref:Defensin-like protein 194 n=1 Tax=Camelina sativa TaxID=90675 RepID=A0ABM0YUX4_CAMSA|nr:PREDICTED: defensin-like protein 194 [Camelina sativa]
MAMATKLVSTFAIFFVLVLVISEMPKTEAHDEQCLKEYVDAPPSFCTARIYPSLCYYRCQADKGAKGGKCFRKIGGDDNPLICFCNFCSDKPTDQFLSYV